MSATPCDIISYTGVIFLIWYLTQKGKTENTSEDSGWSSGWIALAISLVIAFVIGVALDLDIAIFNINVKFYILILIVTILLAQVLILSGLVRWASEDCNLPSKQERLGRICQMARGLQQVPLDFPSQHFHFNIFISTFPPHHFHI